MSALLARVRWFHVLALVVGAGAFAIVVDRVGWQTMREAIVEAGWWFLWIALIDLASVATDAAGLYHFVCTEAPVSYGRVFAAQASGIAINRLTPANSVGEAVKVTMLVDRVPKSVAVAAVVKFNVATMYVALVVIVVGVPLTLLGLELPDRVELAVWIGTAVLVGFAVAVALLLRRGALATVIGGAARLGLVGERRAARWTARCASIDTSIRSFGDPRARRAVAFVAASRVLHFAGTLVVLHAAHIPMTAPVVIGMMSVGIVVTWMSNIVPLGLAVADGTNYLLYGALAASPLAGLVFTTVNRTRTVVLAAMGLAVMLISNVVDQLRRSEDPDEPLSEVRELPDALSEARTK